MSGVCSICSKMVPIPTMIDLLHFLIDGGFGGQKMPPLSFVSAALISLRDSTAAPRNRDLSCLTRKKRQRKPRQHGARRTDAHGARYGVAFLDYRE